MSAIGPAATVRKVPRRWRRLVLAAFGTVVAAIGLLAWQPLWAFDVLAPVFPQVLWRVRTTQPLVALTFDDGPAPDHTPAVLEILARHGAHATFFLIGDRAARHPQFVARLRQEGHEVGSHYFTLSSTRRASDDELLANLTRTEDVLALDGRIKLYRPPGGFIRASQIAVAQAHGYRIVLGSAYPYDPAHPPAAYIRWLVTKNLAPGVIVILHDGIADPSRTLAALDSILVAGEQKGLRFVSVGALLEAAGQ